jgi:catechol 2,3-dioxygenase-like lactoylglutathione lyase family enzyme
MKLNHLNLTVDDVPEARRFLSMYFGLRPYDESRGAKGFDVLFDDDDLVLTLIRGRRNVEISYPETFHIGFIRPSEEDVNAINARLVADGYDVEAPHRAHGAWILPGPGRLHGGGDVLSALR